LSEDEAESLPLSAFWSVAFRSHACSPPGEPEAEGGAYGVHLSKLPLLFGNFVFAVFVRNLFSYKFCFLENVIGALVS
jgi:hypothetical protein